MKCVIPGLNLKVFGRAIHSLSKIGDELYIEPQEDGLALRTVNSSRSAYACFLFSPSFFQHYDDGSGLTSSEDSDEEGFRCKLGMKSILTVFRSLYTIEKTVERCKIHLDSEESRLVFQLHCRHGIVKTHNLAFIECEQLQAVFSKDLCPNRLTAPSKLLCDVVVNFQHNQEEITLIVNPNKVALKNYTDDEQDQAKVVHTELTLTPEEFDNCQVGVDTEITFCLKELRAILAFTEVTNLPLNIHFETPGRPVVFTVDSDQTFEASFVLATLAESEVGASQQPSQVRGKKQTRHNNSKRSYASQSQTHKGGRSRLTQSTASASRLTNGMSHHRPNTSSDRGVAADLDDTVEAEVEINEATIHHGDAMETEQPVTDEGGRLQGSRSPKPSGSTVSDPSPVIPVQSDRPTDTRVPAEESVLQDVGEDEEEEEEEELVPGTPPSKKFRSLFFGLSQSQSTQSQAPPQPTSVLAADTDEED
ncbi:cell cycle checkpoint control protein RAD9A-like isoform X2 [Haliotis rufescens]|uniref:cell cycle checkpoint control protein RAD9A-like isoform X2 n=1 Tax=Haliotis rufescens TaxID=6454 RepID=UPI00201EDABC|nr:cell cycle checkpoint control protein RAD9A-like isoform X2 [Haliotis rufescens]